MKQFFEGLSKRVFVVDPLDRPIISQELGGPNQNIGIEDLKQKVVEMKPISGEDLNLALNDLKYDQLIKMIEKQIKEFNEQFEQYLDEIEHNTKLSEVAKMQYNFDELDEVIEFMANLQFFASQNLIPDANQYYSDFKNNLKIMKIRAETALAQGPTSRDKQESFVIRNLVQQQMTTISLRFMEKNFQSVAKYVVDLLDKYELYQQSGQ